jgi:hypothetical protein
MKGNLQTNLRKVLSNPLVLHRLSLEIKDDPLPAAVLWVETCMRPTWVRMAEYVYLYVCKLLYPSREKQLTVGLAQMKVGLWIDFMKIYFHRVPSISDWENPVVNFYAIKWYLAQNGASASDSLQISHVYTGQVNRYYAALLDEAVMLLRTTYYSSTRPSTEK